MSSRDAWFVGEVIHGDYPAIVRAATFDSVTQYELWKAIWSSLNDGNFHELDHALRRHDGFLDSFVPMTFVGNHDVTRIASQLTDPRHVEHALAVLMTTAGTPSVYAGDEWGYRGVKEERFGGDDAVRPEFPSRPEESRAPWARRLPAASAPDRLAKAKPVAAHREDHVAAAEQRALRVPVEFGRGLARRRPQPRRCGAADVAVGVRSWQRSDRGGLRGTGRGRGRVTRRRTTWLGGTRGLARVQ